MKISTGHFFLQTFVWNLIYIEEWAKQIDIYEVFISPKYIWFKFLFVLFYVFCIFINWGDMGSMEIGLSSTFCSTFSEVQVYLK